MIDLNSIVRPNIANLKPYASARDEYKASEGVFMDANENPYGELNRYPDPYQLKLKQQLAIHKHVQMDSIFVGNGSDEVIDLAFRIFCEPGRDKALTFSPTYGMYRVYANINNVELVEVPLNSEFQINTKSLDPYLNDEYIKLIFICSPNNPTGNLMHREDVEYILRNFNGVVIVDEAYYDFAESPSLVEQIGHYNNLVVCQTFSKAWGLAAARVGLAYSNAEIISLYNKVKPPYNVSRLNQQAAIRALQNTETYQENLNLILSEKKRLRKELEGIALVQNIYPSDANFLLVEVADANSLYKQLINCGIVVRNRSTQVPNCLRISIGTRQENNALIKALKILS